MNEIIINCDNNYNKTIVLSENGKVVEKYIETLESNRLEGNIYFGKVVNVLQGMQAAFIDIGEEQNAFLHIKDIIPKANNSTGNKNEEYSNYNIKDYIRVGMPIIVQVKKDKTYQKGARVSTHLNIAGRFIALMPNLNFITVSQKIEDYNEIIRLKEITTSCDIQNHGIILRTSSFGKSKKEINQDIENVVNLYNTINQLSSKLLKDGGVPQIIYENGGMINKILVDVLDKSVTKIMVNNQEIYENIKDLVITFSNNIKIDFINKDSILDIYDIENQIKKSEARKVWLKCGGFISIDKTEALTAIDVNSGKFTGKISLEETVFKVNEEATIEIAKQLRLRDIGGIVIIDYIDMEYKENEEKIVNILKQYLKNDRAKTQVFGFTPLHLLELTRKHIFSS